MYIIAYIYMTILCICIHIYEYVDIVVETKSVPFNTFGQAPLSVVSGYAKPGMPSWDKFFGSPQPSLVNENRC